MPRWKERTVLKKKVRDVMFLRSPHENSSRVRRLQSLLQKRGWLHGTVDGEFGILTGQACYRGKFWLGYRKPDQSAGDVFVSFLTGERQTTVAMRTRARLRRRKAQQVPVGQKVLIAALARLGTKESPPGSNKVMYSRWYGMVGSWCAMFVSFYWSKYSKSFQRGVRYAYVPYMLHDAMRGVNGLTVTTRPVPGDIPCYDWPGESKGLADHTGLYATEAILQKHAPEAFAEAQRREGPLRVGEFWAVEGNTAVGNDSNGGEVMIRRRDPRMVLHFIHVSK